mmetsp:Transcript_76085/g.149031  ORF Transcript_76085/g.149031 Transcript_76085/m.149031 type:complete len:85 (+) Transcript_76085:1117-1371(+)
MESNLTAQTEVLQGSTALLFLMAPTSHSASKQGNFSLSVVHQTAEKAGLTLGTSSLLSWEWEMGLVLVQALEDWLLVIQPWGLA